jgi:hypothetical protein
MCRTLTSIFSAHFPWSLHAVFLLMCHRAAVLTSPLPIFYGNRGLQKRKNKIFNILPLNCLAINFLKLCIYPPQNGICVLIKMQLRIRVTSTRVQQSQRSTHKETFNSQNTKTKRKAIRTKSIITLLQN